MLKGHTQIQERLNLKNSAEEQNEVKHTKQEVEVSILLKCTKNLPDVGIIFAEIR